MRDILETIREWTNKARALELEAHNILSYHEDSPHRIISLESTHKKLERLNIRQKTLLEEALESTRNRLFRAAHVAAWAAFIDFLWEKIAKTKRIRKIRAIWDFNDIEGLREKIPERQVIDAARDLNVLRKGDVDILCGGLRKRHWCAHPSNYNPGLNETLGFISELLNYIEKLSKKEMDRKKKFIK